MKRRLAILALGALSLGALTAPASASGTQAAGGALDPRLIGAWVNEKMINSGGASLASFSTVRTLQFEGAAERLQPLLDRLGSLYALPAPSATAAERREAAQTKLARPMMRTPRSCIS